MARKKNPDTKYNVLFRKEKNTVYAFTQDWGPNATTGKEEQKRCQLGKIKNNKFIPNPYFLELSVEEQAKYSFPRSKDYDLSIVNALTGKYKNNEDPQNNLLYGDIWLLEQIAEKKKIREDLLNVFKNEDTVNIILSIAMYLITTDGEPLNQMEFWQNIAKFPYSGDLSYDEIEDFLETVTEENRKDLLSLRLKRLKGNKLCVVDYVNHNQFGDAFLNGTDLIQNFFLLTKNEKIIVYTLNEHMPVYYNSYDDTSYNSVSLQRIYEDLESWGIKEPILITNRGYDNLHNLDRVIYDNQSIIAGIRVDQPYLIAKINDFNNADMGKTRGYTGYVDKDIVFIDFKHEHKLNLEQDNIGKNIKLKIILFKPILINFNEIQNIHLDIENQRKKILENKEKQLPINDDNRQLFDYYNLTFNDMTKTIIQFELDEVKKKTEIFIHECVALMLYKASISSMESFHHYNLLKKQEKYNKMAKVMINQESLLNRFESKKVEIINKKIKLYERGILFILFVAQILDNYLIHIFKDKKFSDQFYSSFDIIFNSPLDVLTEMRSIRYIEQQDGTGLITPFNERQKEICKAFGFKVPKGC